MAGHSKWHNIKNAKEKSDAQKEKFSQKLEESLLLL